MAVLYFQGWAGGWVAGGIKSKTSLGPIVRVELYYGPRLAIWAILHYAPLRKDLQVVIATSLSKDRAFPNHWMSVRYPLV